MNKIIPLVLIVSLSLIFGTQAAYAQTVNVWALYCDPNGADDDANPSGTPGGSSVTPECDLANAGTGSGFVRIPWEGGPESYSSVVEQSGGANGPEIFVECFTGTDDPAPNNSFTQWDFNNLASPGANQAAGWDCINNFRADEDLGIGIDDPSLSEPQQVLEAQNNELVALNISQLLAAGYGNFKFIISSNSANEEGWLATSNQGPHDNDMIITSAEVTPLGFFPGCSAGGGCFNNDAYISINNLQNWLYFKQTADGQDNLIQQIMAEKPDDMVGGHGGITDNTALLVSGSHLTASWMIPLIVTAIGIAVFVVTRKQS